MVKSTESLMFYKFFSSFHAFQKGEEQGSISRSSRSSCQSCQESSTCMAWHMVLWPLSANQETHLKLGSSWDYHGIMTGFVRSSWEYDGMDLEWKKMMGFYPSTNWSLGFRNNPQYVYVHALAHVFTCAKACIIMRGHMHTYMIIMFCNDMCVYIHHSMSV